MQVVDGCLFQAERGLLDVGRGPGRCIVLHGFTDRGQNLTDPRAPQRMVWLVSRYLMPAPSR